MNIDEHDTFPEELLQAGIDERLNYFFEYRVAHTRLVSVMETVLKRLHSRTFPVITVMGPAGVGKTTLGEILATSVETSHNFSQDPGRKPALLLEAPAHSKRDFNWKDFFITILEAANEPLIRHKSDQTEIGYGKAVKKMIEHRRPYALIIDEAQHITKKASPAALVHQLDAWKTFVRSIYPTKVVLLGTYELFSYYSVNGQIDRRGRPIHLPRYRSYVAADIDTFIGALYAFQRHLPLEAAPDLVTSEANVRFFYERSVGCIGILKDWLYDALDTGLRDGMESLNFDFVSEFALSISQCNNILDEVRNYENDERLFNPTAKSQLYESMVWSPNPLPPKVPSDNADQSANRGKSKVEPGVRNPTRDPVGTNG